MSDDERPDDDGTPEDDLAGVDFDEDEANLEPLCAPLYGAAGKRYHFFESGILVVSKKGFLKVRKMMLAWSNVRHCSLDWACFSGHLTITMSSGRPIELRSFPWKVKAATRVVHDMMNKVNNNEIEHEEVLEGVKDRYSKIMQSGVRIEVKHMLTCRGLSSFVPWESVVSAELVKGCCSSYIQLQTLIEKPKPPTPAPTATTEEIVDFPVQDEANLSEEEKKKLADARDARAAQKEEIAAMAEAAKKPPPPQFLSVSIRCKAGAGDDVFALIMDLMSGGKPNTEIENTPTLYRTTISEAGVIVDCGGIIFGARKHFLPWTSITACDWLTECFSSPTLVLTDRCGNQTTLKKCSGDDYTRFREIYSRDEEGAGESKAKPIHRRYLSLMPDGVVITKPKGCSKETRFYPWSIVDAAEMDLTCCGGALLLITESGARIPTMKANPFTRGSMQTVWNRIREMKYGFLDKNDGNPRYFAGREGDVRACVLTDKTIRLVTRTGRCSHTARLVDLDSIRGCKSIKGFGCCGKWSLHIYLDEKIAIGMSKQEKTDTGDRDIDDKDDDLKDGSLDIVLWRGDDANDLRDDIMRRAQNRKEAINEE